MRLCPGESTSRNWDESLETKPRRLPLEDGEVCFGCAPNPTVFGTILLLTEGYFFVRFPTWSTFSEVDAQSGSESVRKNDLKRAVVLKHTSV